MFDEGLSAAPLALQDNLAAAAENPSRTSRSQTKASNDIASGVLHTPCTTLPLNKVPVASRLADIAKRFHVICGQAAQQAGENAKKDGTNPSQLQPRLRRAGLKYYADCEISVYTKKQRQLESNSDTGLGKLQSWTQLNLGCLSRSPSMMQGVYDCIWAVQAAAKCGSGICLQGVPLHQQHQHVFSSMPLVLQQP